MPHPAELPEHTSTKVHSGPGSASFQVATDAWNVRASRLSAAAVGFSSVTARMAESWYSPAATEMVTAARPVEEALHAITAEAKQAGTQTSAVIDAFERLQASVAQPTTVYANRDRLEELTRSNVGEQNATAIADCENEYQEIWEQNTAAMENYRAEISAATNQPSQLPQLLQVLSVHSGDGECEAGAANPVLNASLQEDVADAGLLDGGADDPDYDPYYGNPDADHVSDSEGSDSGNDTMLSDNGDNTDSDESSGWEWHPGPRRAR